MMDILAIDDDLGMLTMYEFAMESKGHNVKTLPDPTQIRNMPNVAFIVSDCEIGDYSHEDTLREAKIYHPNTPILFVSGNYDITDKLDNDGEFVMRKPFKVKDLLELGELAYLASKGNGVYSL